MASSESPSSAWLRQGRALTNARLRRLLLAIQTVAGRGALNLILEQARLRRYSGGLPPANHLPQTWAAEYAAVARAIGVYYGRNARNVLVQIGRIAFRQLPADAPWRARLYRAAFLFLPVAARQRLALQWLGRETAAPQGRVSVTLQQGRLVFEDYESDPLFGQSSADIGCALTLGEVQAALYWATGREYEVTETQCKAHGAPACCFEVGAPLT
ncbi:MAG: 4-vinyl reductase [Anaerolineales bacterium]|nr:4-vinyl reductase [Anaerolineales bacterium]